MDQKAVRHVLANKQRLSHLKHLMLPLVKSIGDDEYEALRAVCADVAVHRTN